MEAIILSLFDDVLSSGNGIRLLSLFAYGLLIIQEPKKKTLNECPAAIEREANDNHPVVEVYLGFQPSGEDRAYRDDRDRDDEPRDAFEDMLGCLGLVVVDGHLPYRAFEEVGQREDESAKHHQSSDGNLPFAALASVFSGPAHDKYGYKGSDV